MSLPEKRAHLECRLAGLRGLLVAYSGGVDSAVLAYFARQVLGEDIIAVIADSPSLARRQLADAVAFAEEHHIPLHIVHTAELERPDYVSNRGDRCFHCKDELFDLMEDYRARHGFDHLAYGMNVDDQGDFRPGQQAARQHHVAAPLAEAGLTKSDVRELARQAGLRLWEKPAAPCLSSRIEYGRPVTREALSAIEQGEDALHALGFREFRVRHHGDLVRIEIAPAELSRALDAAMAAEFCRIFKSLGYLYVTLDLEGFRSGSLNAVLPVSTLARMR
jgi:uncharacterized protein